MNQDYQSVVDNFLGERKVSVRWLRQLQDPHWTNEIIRPGHESLSAATILANWVAHDYFHFRQVTRLKYEWLNAYGSHSLAYAGDW